ncbi:MAG TPA: hypothetical protein VH392_07225, partial [Sphingomicrobium sp.]
MFLPVSAARWSLARPRKPRAILAAAIVPRAVEARLVEMARALAGGPGIAPAAVIALLPRLVFTALGAVAKLLARPTRESLLAIARGSIAKGTVATRPIAVLPETFSARRVGTLVAELLVLKPPGWARVIPVTSRRAGVTIPIKVRPIAARLERALLAIAILTLAEILARATIAGVALAISGVAFAISEIATGTVVPVEARPRPIAKIPARRTIIAIALAGIGLLAKRFCPSGLPGIGTPLAAVVPGAEPALGELLLRSPRRPRAALASAGVAL